MSVVAQYNQSSAGVRFLRADAVADCGKHCRLHAGMAGLKL